MRKWKMVMVGVMLAGALAGWAGSVQAQEGHPSAAYQSMVEQCKQQERQIQELKKRLRTESRELRQLVHKKEDAAYRKQVRQDLQGFHAQLEKAHELRRAAEDLKKQLHAARLKKEDDEMEKIVAQILRNKEEQVECLQGAKADLEKELAKVRAELGA
jgi:chromosome segregation ATPase